MAIELDDLRAVQLFSSLSTDDLERVRSWLEQRDAGPGDRMTPEGASGYSFFVILAGGVVVDHEGTRIARLGAGDYFGEGALLGSTGLRNCDVVADSPVRLAVMHGTHFRELEDQFPQLVAEIRETMAARDSERADEAD